MKQICLYVVIIACLFIMFGNKTENDITINDLIETKVILEDVTEEDFTAEEIEEAFEYKVNPALLKSGNVFLKFIGFWQCGREVLREIIENNEEV